MLKLTDKALEFLDDIIWKLSPHPPLPTGEPVCNISAKTNEWNKKALEYAWRPGNSLVPYRREFSEEEMQRMQQRTYELNRKAPDYANSIIPKVLYIPKLLYIFKFVPDLFRSFVS